MASGKAAGPQMSRQTEQEGHVTNQHFSYQKTLAAAQHSRGTTLICLEIIPIASD